MVELLTRYWPALLGGFQVTLLVAAVVTVVGLSLGGLVGLIAGTSGGVALGTVRVFSLLVGAVPLLVILFWFHYPVQVALGIVVDPLYTLIAVLAAVNVVFVADAVARVVHGQPWEWATMARVLGMRRGDVLRRIVLPLALRQLVGPLLAIQVGMLQATIFGSLISVNELFRVVQRIDSIEFDPVKVYSLLAIFFLIICAPLHWLADRLARQAAVDLSVR